MNHVIGDWCNLTKSWGENCKPSTEAIWDKDSSELSHVTEWEIHHFYQDHVVGIVIVEGGTVLLTIV